MTTQENPSNYDALAELEKTEAVSLSVSAAVVSVLNRTETADSPTFAVDMLASLQDPLAFSEEQIAEPVKQIANSARTESSLSKSYLEDCSSGRSMLARAFNKSRLFENAKFLVHYLAVSATVFGILLVATNWSAYSTIAMDIINPNGTKNTSNQIIETLSQSKITVFANDSSLANVTQQKEKAEDIKKQLDAEKIAVDEDAFSIKSLLPSEPNIAASFAITPYENRIIIPKIGKNVPLVDVISSGFDFDHMENIFMQELEKGVVRYPGSAVPGQKGNSFIFWHSSNYPWVKWDYNEVFALLDNVEFGDQIIVYYNQKKYVYTVREKKIVRPGDVKALERDSDKAELSLMTCWPIGTTLKRMLVFAELTPQ